MNQSIEARMQYIEDELKAIRKELEESLGMYKRRSKYEQSEWFKGLLFAEEQANNGWRVCELDYVEQWFSWTFEDTKAKQTVFGECGWLDGVRDFYKNRNENVKRWCEGLI